MQKEYIEREAAKELFRIWISDCVLNGDNDAADCYRNCIDLLDSIPAADVAPVQSEVNKGSMQQEYITKNRAKQFVCRHCNKVCSEEPCEPSDCDWMAFIDKEPAADVVEVVRCRECKYWGDEAGELQRSDGVLFARCKVHNYLLDGRHTGWCPTENDFCSYGERKGGADNG